MATVSRQSAFWAVVALGLNTFVQPGAKVLDFPAEYSRALRLSPIVCIIDTLGVLYSVAFFSCRTRSFNDGLTLAARYRCLTEDDPAEPKLERTWWFRFSIYAFGALPQAVKLLAMGGVPLTKIWGMAYLVSFLVLEGLDLLQPRQRRDDHLLETDVAVLNMKKWLPGSHAVVTQLFCFIFITSGIPGLDSKCNSRGVSPPQPEFGALMGILYLMTCLALLVVPPCIIVMAYIFVTRLTSRLSMRTIRPLLRDDVEMIQDSLFLLLVAAYLVGLCILLDRVKSICSNRAGLVSTVTPILLLTFFAWVFLCQETAFKSPWFRGLFGVTPLKQRKASIFLLFAAGNIASIIYYYMFIYDPSSTYKPPWTEKLG